MTHYANRGAGTFFSANKAIFNDPLLNSTAILVYLALASHADYHTGQVSLSRAKIANLIEKTPQSVGTALNLLESTGWLHRVTASVYDKGANRYTLHVLEMAPKEFIPPDNGKSKILENTNQEIPKPESKKKQKHARSDDDYREGIAEYKEKMEERYRYLDMDIDPELLY